MTENTVEDKTLYTIIDSIGDAVITTDIKGSIVRINPAAEKLTGWTLNICYDKILSNVFKILNTKTIETIEDPIVKVMESGQIEELPDNTFLISRKGEKYNITGSAIPVKGLSGSIQEVVIVFRQVSEEYQLNRELKKYDAQYKAALKGSSLGLWEWVRALDTISFSKQSQRIIGLNENAACVSFDEWRLHLYSDDRKSFYDNICSSLKSSSPLYQDEFRIVSEEEGFKWILAKGMIVSRDEDGTPFRMIGTIADVTKRRQAEEELRIERDNFVNIFNSMKDGVFIVNNGYGIQYINPALKKDFGESTGKKCYEYLYQRKTKCPLCEISKAVVGDKIHRELNSHISQKIYDVMTTTIKNPDSTISVMEILRDITIRKTAEEEVKKQLLEKEMVLKEVHHRIKNNFASIGNLLSMQVDSLTNYAAVSALNDAIGRVKSMQILYEKLLLSDEYNVTSIKHYLDNLIDEIVALYPDNIRITMFKQIDDFPLDPKRLVSLGIIVNELLTNVMKYAFDGRTSGHIEVVLTRNKKNAALIIQDDGNGLPENFNLEQQSGFGLMLVKMLIIQFEGDFSIENHEGTRSIMNFCI